MEELSEQERSRILEERRAKFARLGIPNAGQINQTSVVMNESTGQMSMHQKLQAIKSGKLRNEFSQYLNADSKKAPGSFQEIPTTRKKVSRPGQPTGPQVSSEEYKVPLNTFEAKEPAGELGMIAAMFGEGSGGGSYGPDLTSYASSAPGGELDVNSIMNRVPDFDHREALRRAREKASGGYTQFAQRGAPVTREDLVYNEHGDLVEAPRAYAPQAPASQLDIRAIQEVVQSMSQVIAESAIKAAMEITEKKNKNKGSFEWYDKDRNIIIFEGKVFVIKEVAITSKRS